MLENKEDPDFLERMIPNFNSNELNRQFKKKLKEFLSAIEYVNT